MDILDHLTDSDLAALVFALRSGRLQGPYTLVSVQRYCTPSHAAGVAAFMQGLHEEGMQPGHLGLLVEAARRGRTGQGSSETVDLVWTGPETLGITNRDTAVVVRELFGSAEREVVVAGFAVYQGKEVFRRLAERMSERPELNVRLFLDVHRLSGDASVPDEVVRRFVQRFRTHEWPGERLPELRYDPRSLELDGAKRASLHAKCIVVDRKVAFVTSANFTEAAQARNIEVGALIHSERFAERLADHFNVLAINGLLLLLTSSGT
jgi:hypothetical protein